MAKEIDVGASQMGVEILTKCKLVRIYYG